LLRIASNKWFSLPRLGRDTFSELMRARVKYDTKFGFKISSDTDIPRALSILSRALDQPVELQSSCFICDRPLGEGDEPGSSICAECKNRDDAYALYTMKFATLAENQQ
jgi:hypothetical protein